MLQMSGYLAACAIFRNEARYLPEWVAFHLVVGVEHLFLYNNLSDDGYAEVLERFVAAGSVTLIDWPTHPGQIQAYDDCIQRTRGLWRWVAFIDLDEFLFSPQIRPVPEVLTQFEDISGLGVPWAQYGTSGHGRPPPGLVIENYVHRRVGRRNLRQFKSVVDPSAVVRCVSPHTFRYAHPGPVPRFASYHDLRVNHYYSRSQVELEAKLGSQQAHSGQLRNRRVYRRIMKEPTVHDDVIATYAPAVREAMRR
jgi:glycosyl transferase family 92